MIDFQELRITSDSKNIIIDVLVPEEYWYKNVYLDKIIIDTQDTYTQAGPSSKPVYTWTAPDGKLYDEDDNIVFADDQEAVYVLDDFGNIIGIKHIRLVLCKSDVPIDFDKNMFFVYVTTKGIPIVDNNTPCRVDEDITMGVLINLYPIYQQSMNYLNELSTTCSVPQEFPDYILKLKALQLAVKTGNYNQAIELWNKNVLNAKRTISNKPKCGCHAASI